jgi:Zn-dependent peptidase ImmA (M78 family)/transcriptional regulator with XRE-family HTH domain
LFYGDKLTELRELNSLSRKDLADKLSVSEQAVWQYESGKVSPRIDVLNALRDLLEIDTSFLFEPHTITGAVASEDHIAYRADDRKSRKKTRAELTYLKYVEAFVDYFEGFLGKESRSIDSLRAVAAQQSDSIQYADSKNERNSVIEALAEMSRSYLNIKNNRDLMYTIENAGVCVVERNLGQEIDAYSTISKSGRSYIVLGTHKKSAVRRNFDLVHELGHLLMHQRLNIEMLTNEEYKEIEAQANRFAGAFLLPRTAFMQDFATLPRKSNPDAYLDLKSKYRVSIAAMGHRAYDLGLLDYQEYRYFNGRMNSLHYRKLEPLDDKIVPIRPGKMRALMEFLLKSKQTSVDRIRTLFHVRPQFVINLFGIDQHFFDQFVHEQRNYYGGAKVIKMPRV